MSIYDLKKILRELDGNPKPAAGETCQCGLLSRPTLDGHCAICCLRLPAAPSPASSPRKDDPRVLSPYNAIGYAPAEKPEGERPSDAEYVGPAPRYSPDPGPLSTEPLIRRVGERERPGTLEEILSHVDAAQQWILKYKVHKLGKVAFHLEQASQLLIAGIEGQPIAPEAAPPLEHVFANRFNADWTPEKENELLKKAAQKTVAPEAAPKDDEMKLGQMTEEEKQECRLDQLDEAEAAPNYVNHHPAEGPTCPICGSTIIGPKCLSCLGIPAAPAAPSGEQTFPNTVKEFYDWWFSQPVRVIQWRISAQVAAIEFAEAYAEHRLSTLRRQRDQLKKYEALYAEARESLCSCNLVDRTAPLGSPYNYLCEWCEKHPSGAEVPEVLADLWKAEAQLRELTTRLSWADAANEAWLEHCIKQSERITELRSTIERLTEKNQHDTRTILDQAKTIERLRHDLETYGEHMDGCALMGQTMPVDAKCSCGWSDILREL